MTVAGERPSRRFRLLFLSHSPGMGGAERCLVELTSALRELGHTCVVALPGAGPLLDALRREGVRTAVTEIPWWVSPAPPRVRTRAGSMAKIGPASFHLSRLVVREGCDVVLTNTLATPVGALAARLAGRPHVWLVHELARRSQGFWWHLPEAWALRLVDRFSAAVVANSSATQTRFASHVHRALLVRIYPSVTPVRVRPMPRRDVRVALIVGHRKPGKGVEDAIRALALLRRQHLPWRLDVVGPGESASDAELHRLAASLGVEDSVRVLPPVDDIGECLGTADVLLNCSIDEGFGRVTVEAMMATVPVVGARSGATPELLGCAGVRGLLYNPGRPEQLAEAVARLDGDVALRERIVAAALTWAQPAFTPRRYGQEVADVVAHAIDGRR